MSFCILHARNVALIVVKKSWILSISNNRYGNICVGYFFPDRFYIGHVDVDSSIWRRRIDDQTKSHNMTRYTSDDYGSVVKK